jgi:phosphoribosylanthranilate isomerase
MASIQAAFDVRYTEGMIQTKICGLSTPETVAIAVDHGATWIGFVTYPKSPRHVTPERAGELARPVRSRVKTVSVLVNPDDMAVRRVLMALKPDFIQLHGDETPERAAAIRARGVGIIKAIAVSSTADALAAQAYRSCADMILFDAKPPAGADLPGGNGVGYDPAILRGVDPGLPWMLSGGLTPQTVKAAAAAAGAAAVDVSSGVERAPGLKDGQRIADFLAALA